MKKRLSKIILCVLGLGVLGYAVGVTISIFASFNGNFNTEAFSDGISLGCLVIGATLGFVLGVTAKISKESKTKGKTKGKTAEGENFDLHYDAHFITEDEIEKNDSIGQLISTSWGKLPSLKKTGFVMRNSYVGKQYKITMKHEVHTLVIGTTGSGKTSGVIDPTIRILAHTGEKPCFVISDPKGELYDRHSEILKKEGYNVIVYDLDNPFISACWNPMENAFNLYQEAHNLYKKAKKYSNCKPEDVNKQRISGAEYGDSWYEFEGLAFPDEQSLRTELESKKTQMIAACNADLRGVAMAIAPIDERSNDKTWDQGAQDFLYATMLAMLEDSVDERLGSNKLRLDQFNFYNLFKVLNRKDASQDNPYETLRRFFAGRSITSDLYGMASAVINSAPSTTKSYMSVLGGKVNSLLEDKGIEYATSRTDIDFSGFVDRPTAFFIKIPDHKKERHPLAVVCITQLYRRLVESANKYPEQTLPRSVYFILDEFGSSLPMIPDFATMVTVARSRKIFFEIVVQSYTQLDTRYGKDIAETLRGNFNATIFLGTEDAQTKEAFSKSCGEVQLIYEEESKSENKGKSDTSKTTSTSIQRTTRPLVSPFELGQLPFMTAIVTMFRLPPMKTLLTQFHKTEFMEKLSAQKITGISKSINETEVFYDIGKRNEIVLGPARRSRW